MIQYFEAYMRHCATISMIKVISCEFELEIIQLDIHITVGPWKMWNIITNVYQIQYPTRYLELFLWNLS